MITKKDKLLTFTGKDAVQLDKLAKSLNKTPQEALELALKEHMALLKKENKETKKRKK